MLRAVRLEGLLQREAGGERGLDCRADWASILSLGEQQRLAFTRQGDLMRRPHALSCNTIEHPHHC